MQAEVFWVGIGGGVRERQQTWGNAGALQGGLPLSADCQIADDALKARLLRCTPLLPLAFDANLDRLSAPRLRLRPRDRAPCGEFCPQVNHKAVAGY